MKELEKHLTSSDYNFTSESQLRAAVAVDFMSLIRRCRTSKLKIFNGLFSIATYSILHIPCVEEIDIVYNSYLEDSIKECERICRHSSCEPLEFLNLKTTMSIPVQVDRFWACGKNKEAIQEISHDFFKSVSSKSQHSIVLSGYVTDLEGIKPCIEQYQGDLQTCPDLDSMIEEADSRIILHIQKAVMRGVLRVIVHSNDTDVVVFLLYYIHYFINLGIEHLWIKFGIGDKSRHIPVHKLVVVLGTQLCKVILKSYVLFGCDVTSKVGTKAAALNSELEQYLKSFGEMNEPSLESFEKAEKFLVQVWRKNSKCTNFNQLRN